MEQYPKLRKLTRRDRRTFGSLLDKLVEKTGSKSLTEMVPKTPSANAQTEQKSEAETTAEILELACNILTGMLKFIDDDLGEWFADILDGVESVEEFDELQFDIEVHVIEQLLESEDFANFFSRGSRVFKKTKDFVSRLRN